MTTRESAVAAALQDAGARDLVGDQWTSLEVRAWRSGRDSTIAAVLAALDTTPQPALGDDADGLADWLGAMDESVNVFDITDEATTVISIDVETLAQRLTARAHQPTSPAQAEAVAALDEVERRILDRPYWRDQAVTHADLRIVREVRAALDPLTTARAIADTAAAEAGSADTAARVKGTGGD